MSQKTWKLTNDLNIVFYFQSSINVSLNELSKMWSTFCVSGEQIKFPNISVNFEGKKLVNSTFWRLVLFGVQCINCDTTQLCLRKYLDWNKNKSRHLITMFIGTPCTNKLRYKARQS